MTCYKDIQTTSTNTAVTSQPLTNITSASTSTVSPVKTTGSQVKKPLGKGKTVKPVDKGKKHVAFSSTSMPTATTSTVSTPNLRNKL